MKRVLLIVLFPAGIIIAVMIAGLVLPSSHVAERTAELHQPPEVVWGVITDHANEPSWVPGLASKQRVADRDGHPAWQETADGGDMTTYLIIESEPPRRLVTRIADEKHFGGTWTYELLPAAGGCTLTITEHGEIYNPILRVLAKTVIGYTGRMDVYLAALSQKLEAGH